MPTTRAQRRAAATNGTAKARPARTSKSSHVDAPATARKGASRRGRNKRSNSGSNTAGSSSARAPATRPQGGRGSRRVQAEGKPLHGVGAGVEDIVLNPSEWCCSECGTTDDLSICLRCGFIGCGSDGDNHGANHTCGGDTRSTSYWLHLNEHHHPVTRGHEGAKVPAVEEEAVQGLIQLKSLLFKIQHLDYDTGFGADTANSTPRTRAKQHWRLVRRVMVLKKFTFLSAAAVQRRKAEDQLATALYRWQHGTILRCFNAMKESWLSKRRHKKRQSKVVLADGRVGLRNLGNTCYMNSVTQCLSHAPSFRDWVLRFTPVEHVDVASPLALHQTLATVFTRMWGGNLRVYSPDCLLKVVWKLFPQFTGFKQQDAGEFLCVLLEQLRDGLAAHNSGSSDKKTLAAPPTTTSRRRGRLSAGAGSGAGAGAGAGAALEAAPTVETLTTMLDGALERRIECHSCDYASVTPLPFFGMLAVTIPPKYQQRRGTSRSRGGPVATVHDCIDYTLMDEEMTGSEQYFCDSCNGKQDARKVLHLTQTPRLLVIHVIRTAWTSTGAKKIDAHVHFPLDDLDLTPYFAPHADGSRSMYRLTGAVTHLGRTVNSGHYIAFARDTDGSTFMCLNDKKVKVIDDSELWRSNAYLLFYELTTDSMWHHKSKAVDEGDSTLQPASKRRRFA